MLIALPVFTRLFEGAASNPDLIIIAAAFLFALLFTLAYLRSGAFQTLFAFAGFVVVLIPVLFLFFSPIRGIISSGNEKGLNTLEAKEFKHETPIVVVVLDEFPITSIMDGTGRIEQGLFPNFAALADGAHWFRNATTVSADTNYAVPAILTGKMPDTLERLPNRNDYPDNLFTLLEQGYDLNVSESTTQLLSAEHNRGAEEGFLRRFSMTLSDLYLIYLHIIAPPGLSKGLVPVDLTWEGFAVEEEDKLKPHEKAEERLNRLSNFIKGITKTGLKGERTLNFIHVVLPHSPWIFYPSGATYGAYGSGTRGITGLDEEQWWTDDEWPVVQAYQRHLLQVAYADKMIGELLARLKQEGLYDPSLIVVVADHGISFRPGDHMRSLTDTNFSEIISIPLFIKEPYQKSGDVNDKNVEIIDILPTIADILDVRIPWTMDGTSMIDPDMVERPKKVVYNGHWVEGELNKRYEFSPEVND